MRDMFGVEVSEAEALKISKRKTPATAGYAWQIGSGPKGETCKTCKHATRFGRYSKCSVVKARWSHGRKTDILLKAPACKFWEAEK